MRKIITHIYVDYLNFEEIPTTPNILQLSHIIQVRYCQVGQIRLNGSGNSPQLFITLSSHFCINSDYAYEQSDMYLGGT